jgi:hypothetical protein
MEFATAETTVIPGPGATAEVALEPERLYETAARGWYGGDLHVHMNYSGDQIRGPTTRSACSSARASTWLCAVARGPGHPSVPGPVVFAHTSSAWVEVAAVLDRARAWYRTAIDDPIC